MLDQISNILHAGSMGSEGTDGLTEDDVRGRTTGEEGEEAGKKRDEEEGKEPNGQKRMQVDEELESIGCPGTGERERCE